MENKLVFLFPISIFKTMDLFRQYSKVTDLDGTKNSTPIGQ